MSEPSKNAELDLARVYKFRFTLIPAETKYKTWLIITKWIENKLGQSKTVLDPASGLGEFIIASTAEEKWACDLIDQRDSWPSTVKTRFGEIFEIDLPNNHFEMIFVSNFLEHLPTPDHIYRYLMLLRSKLKPSGKIVIMGPNYRYSSKEYFDFADHLLPLTHRTIEEHLAAANLDCKLIIKKFLPLSFRSQRFSFPILVKIYLAIPIFWKVFGKQFFIVATRPSLS